jgi:hypothetical protein
MGHEQVVQRQTCRRLVESCGNAAEQQQRRELFAVFAEAAEAVVGVELEQVPGPLAVAGQPVHHRQAGGVACPLGGIDIEQPFEGGRVGCSSLRSVDAERQGRGHHRRVVACCGVGRRRDLVAPPLGAVEVPSEQCSHSAEQGYVPTHQWLAELLGEAGERGDVAVDGGDVADLEICNDSVSVAQQLQYPVTGDHASSTIVSALSRRVIV